MTEPLTQSPAEHEAAPEAEAPARRRRTPAALRRVLRRTPSQPPWSPPAAGLPAPGNPGSQFRMTEPLTQSPAEHEAAPEAEAPARRRRTPAALRRVLRRTRSLPPWSPLAAGVLAGGLLGAGYGLAATPQYTATAYVVAVPTDKSDPASALGFAQAYGRVATQLAVLGDAQMWAHVPVATLERSVRTATSPDAPMVSVTAASAHPEEAADMANAVARALTRHAEASADDTHVELRQFARATEPTEASSASASVTGLVGAAAGGLLGGLALLVRPRRTAREPGRAAAVPGPASAADVRGQL